MKLTLNNFEQLIDTRILTRGDDYYHTGQVRNVTRLTDTLWEATVTGNRKYTVTITLKKGVINGLDCTCPYDWGPVCKHQVAVLYTLRDNLKPERKNGNSTQEPPVMARVAEILKKRNRKQLEELILEEALASHSFRSKLLSRFIAVTDTSDTGDFRRIVRAYINGISDEYDYDDSMIPEFTVPLQETLDKALKTARSGRLHAILPLCRTAVEEIAAAWECHDENGDLHYLLDAFLGIVCAIPRSRLTGPDRVEAIDFCLESAGQRAFVNGGRDWDFIEAAAGFVQTAGERQQVTACMDRHGAPLYDADGEKRISIEYAMQKRTGTMKERNSFIAANLQYRCIRTEAVRSALKAKDTITAGRLAREGLEELVKNSNRRYQDERHWYEILMDIAVQSRDAGKMAEYGLILLEKTNEYCWYVLLKKKIPAGQWPAMLEKILAVLSRHGGGLHRDALPRILIREKKLDRLMDLVRIRPSFHTLSTYDTVLKKKYSAELAGLYSKAIMAYLERNMGRSAYQETVRMLRRMKKMGVTDEMEKVIGRIRKTYFRRPALLDELKRL